MEPTFVFEGLFPERIDPQVIFWLLNCLAMYDGYRN